MTQPEIPVTVVDVLGAVPQQRTAPDDLLPVPAVGPVTDPVSGPSVSRARRRWTLVRALLLPIGAVYLYVGSMAGMASLDRLLAGTAAVDVLTSPVVALAAAALAMLFVVTGARVVRGALAR
jgi:hypothetical protein